MSAKISEMYKLDRTIGLVTIASPVCQNLALLDLDEYLIADSLAVIHGGYINYIPIINAARRCKYVSIGTGKDRGSGCILCIKWLKIEHETFLIVLSSLGLQIYDAEVCEAIYEYKFKAVENEKVAVPVGAAILEDGILCVGVADGFAYMFRDCGGHSFEFIHRVRIDEFMLFDGLQTQIVVATRENLYSWNFKDCMLVHKKQLATESLKSSPSVLKVVPELALVGYENGEMGLYSTDFYRTLIKIEAHKGKITALDYSVQKNMILTGSADKHVKVWKFNFTHLTISSIFTVESNYQFCGVGFLNLQCTEFCTVKSNNITVDVFVKVEKEYE